MTATHDAPDPDFVRHLEWQLRTELRRGARFRVRAETFRWPLAAAAVLAALALGFAGATAAQEYGSRAQTRYLRIQAESAVELAGMRVDYASEMLGELEAAGTDRDAIAALHWEVMLAQLEARRAMLDLEELQASGQAARDGLDAPLVQGRDFVQERLLLERDRFEAMQVRLMSEVARLADPDSARALTLELASLDEEIARVDSQLELRSQFLTDRANAVGTLGRHRLQEAEAEVRLADLRLATVQDHVSAVRERHARGETDRIDVRAAEFELARARIDARLARAQLEMAVEAER